MRCRFSACLVTLVACGGAPPSSSVPANSPAARTGQSSSSSRSLCTAPAQPSEPLAQSELELAAAPQDIAVAREQLLGVWDGHAYSLAGELGQPGPPPTSEDPVVACFAGDGQLIKLEAPDPDREEQTGCSPRARTYSLTRDDEHGGTLMLSVTITGGCPNDAGYGTPYVSPYHVHRLDDRYLVLVDGVTGGVTGYRRR